MSVVGFVVQRKGNKLDPWDYDDLLFGRRKQTIFQSIWARIRSWRRR